MHPYCFFFFPSEGSHLRGDEKKKNAELNKKKKMKSAAWVDGYLIFLAKKTCRVRPKKAGWSTVRLNREILRSTIKSCFVLQMGKKLMALKRKCIELLSFFYLDLLEDLKKKGRVWPNE